MPFMDSKTLLTTMFSILMFRIFVVQWLFVLSFFVLLMLIKKRGGGNLKRPSDAVVLLSSCHRHFISSTQWPVFWKWGAKSISGYFTFWWCLCMCIYVYISIRISTWLCHSVFIDKNIPLMSDSVVPFFFFCCGLFWFWVKKKKIKKMCWFIHLKTRCQ